MKRFTTLVFATVSLCFTGLLLAQAAGENSRAACIKKCTDTFKTCKADAGGDKDKLAACTEALKACVKQCPPPPAAVQPKDPSTTGQP